MRWVWLLVAAGCGATQVAAGPSRSLPPAEALRFPLPGAVVCSRGFSPEQRHFGVDVPAPEGTPVRASAAGVVVRASPHRVYGLVAIVRHVEAYTLYAHLSELAVNVGESVTGGAVVGEVGSTGNARGAHLHWEVLRGVDVPLPDSGPLGISGEAFRVDPLGEAEDVPAGCSGLAAY